MNTDGVNILENEISHDIYWHVLDRYDAGEKFEKILIQKPFTADFSDPVDQENYTIGYALAAWEIGMLSPFMHATTLSIIQDQASVKDWTESFSDAMGKMRQKELQRFIDKISSPNPKIRKPKKYKSVEKYLFTQNEIISFLLPNKNYACAIVLNIVEKRGVCTYYLGKIVYNRPSVPTIQDIENACIVGDKGNSKNGMLALSLFAPEESSSFGLYQIAIEHKKFLKFDEQIKQIGKIALTEECKTASSTSVVNTLQDLILQFNTPEEFYKVSRNKVYKIRELLK